jgi:hypothetical protein
VRVRGVSPRASLLSDGRLRSDSASGTCMWLQLGMGLIGPVGTGAFYVGLISFRLVVVVDWRDAHRTMILDSFHEGDAVGPRLMEKLVEIGMKGRARFGYVRVSVGSRVCPGADTRRLLVQAPLIGMRWIGWL